MAVSAGSRGGSLLLDGTFVQAAPSSVTVADAAGGAVGDAVGAEDAFVAGLTDGVCRGLPPAAILRRANALGALVASRPGALAPWSPAELAAHE